MTEEIQKAIDKIDGEAEKLNNVNARVIASHIIDTYLNSDENADKVLDDKHTMKGCFNRIISKARKRAENNCAMVEDDTVFDWAKEYYGFAVACKNESKIIDILDFM